MEKGQNIQTHFPEKHNLIDIKDNSFKEKKCLLRQHRLVFVVVYLGWQGSTSVITHWVDKDIRSYYIYRLPVRIKKSCGL